MDLFSPLIEHAIELAAQWHHDTFRKSRWRDPAFEPPEEVALAVPTIAHVTAVAVTVQRAGWEDVVVAAAFLHDVLEDVNRYGQTFRCERMRELVGEAVTTLVENVTEKKIDAEGRFIPWRARKEAYVARLRQGSPAAAAISLADKLHNLWSMNESLERGLDVFSPGPNRKALSAGPEQQSWFHGAVLEASGVHADPRLEPMRARLQHEVRRFEKLTGLEHPPLRHSLD